MSVRLIFKSIEDSINKSELECFATTKLQLFIEIKAAGLPPSWIYLDKSTAIKFSKTLRTEISKL